MTEQSSPDPEEQATEQGYRDTAEEDAYERSREAEVDPAAGKSPTSGEEEVGGG